MATVSPPKNPLGLALFPPGPLTISYANITDVAHAARQAHTNIPEQKNYVSTYKEVSVIPLSWQDAWAVEQEPKKGYKTSFLLCNIVTRLHQNYRKGHLQGNDRSKFHMAWLIVTTVTINIIFFMKSIMQFFTVTTSILMVVTEIVSLWE